MDTSRLQSEEIAPLGTDPTPQILRRSSRIKAKNETSTPTKPAEQPQDYPRASFMGLPVEMRMRIYGFLVNGGRVIDPGANGSECARENGGRGKLGDGTRFLFVAPKCSCTESVWPQILATNSVIFMEAMPVLYSTTAFHVGFPKFGDGRSPSCRTALSTLPKYGASHIRHLVLSATLGLMSIAIYRPESHMDDLSLHWTWLRSLDLKLVSIRLCLIAEAVRAMTCLHLDVTPFIGLLSVSRAENIWLQVPCDIDEDVEYDSDDGDMDYLVDENDVRTNRLRDKLLAALRTEAKRMDHHPDIVDISDKWLEF
ncbi:unnamed protein product [Zymoseptoria tritici ST99CH_1A5]|uniref:Uncharacterized protein n=2 Tax=Zymoseptoria tritici TaxID=1047171 RepID=A0A2H1H328_ZYMTR|nr:unnamed protein product [Zymoseptoria tritici ST99CH_1E4]SMR63336.1 unnamed protein product [Zymoseptoria tritici ST99CH_3D1]SMY28678.1 unnamed protein product [Zymoseptoria tritici ST99CH_1A5]